MAKSAIAILLFSAAALAQDAPPDLTLMDLEHARNFAMGGAYRSLGVGTEAIDGNPASITLVKHYLLEGTGSWEYRSKDTWGSIGILDSTSPVGAGISYHLASLGRGPDQTVAHITTTALAYPVSESLHIGLSGKNILMTGAHTANAITMDAGILLHLTSSLVFSLTGNNLIDINNPFIHRYYTFSGAFLAGLFTVAADVRGDNIGMAGGAQLSPSVGAEYILGQSFPLRAGYQYNALTHSHFVGGGLGFMTEGGGVDLGYRHEVGGAQGRVIALTLRIQFS